MAFIELFEGFHVRPSQVAVVKAGLDDTCALFTSGQSATDGFLVPYSADDVVQQLDDAEADEGLDEEEQPAEEEDE